MTFGSLGSHHPGYAQERERIMAEMAEIHATLKSLKEIDEEHSRIYWQRQNVSSRNWKTIKATPTDRSREAVGERTGYTSTFKAIDRAFKAIDQERKQMQHEDFKRRMKEMAKLQ